MGVVPDTAFAKADRETARRGFATLGAAMGMDGDALATAVLDLACTKVVTQVRALVDEYRLQPSSVDLIGGGGGAASLVPHAGALMGVPWRLARQAEVISPIGVALAMVRDTIERNIVDPTPADVLRVRQEAVEAAVRNGALAETVQVHVEVDTRRNLVRAVAVGSAELRRGGASDRVIDEDGRRSAAARSMQRDPAGRDPGRRDQPAGRLHVPGSMSAPGGSHGVATPRSCASWTAAASFGSSARMRWCAGVP